MKRITLILVSLMLLLAPVRADEGMWLLSLIGKNYQQMKALGFKLTPEDIYSINHSSLKDAVGAMNGGMCTMELVSPKGLLLTNHHCGYNFIQQHSTVENDYLKNGFWAASYEEELPNPGLTVWFLVEMKDVTKEVLSQVDDNMSEKEREAVIRRISQKLEDEAVNGDDNYVAQVKSMFDNNQYFLFKYIVYRDVRLVGTPPESIGKFGGDTDNWMWPRHTGDFSVFRIYVAPDGSPADYSPDNVPLEPKKYLPISLKGVKEGDFAMIMGFPGTTNRYLTSWEVKQTMDHENAIRVDVRTQKLAIMKKYMDQNPETRLKYAAKYAQSANYWKYSLEQNKALKRLKVVKAKKKMQKELTAWIKANPEREKKYGEAFGLIKDAVKKSSDIDVAMNYWFEALYLGSELVRAGLRTRQLVMMPGQNEEQKKQAQEELRKYADNFFKDYDQALDKELFVKLYQLYKDKVKKEFYPSVFKDIDEAGGFEKFADELYAKSFLTDKDRFLKFVNNPDYATWAKDPGIKVTNSVIETYSKIRSEFEPYEYQQAKGRRLYMEAYLKYMAEKYPNKPLYPDANSTERLTYGTVKGYTSDANKGYYKTTDSYDPETHHFKYYTTIDGYLDKYEHYKNTPNADEFEVPEKLVELIKNKDFGQYADPSDGTIHTCFLSTNDITGGNSGSPVINGNGELIGLAFDGNSEAMSGDILFEPQLQRTINVDIRFVLFIIDKYAGATRLIDEMTLVK